MTLKYTETPTEQARRAIEELGEKVRGKVN
jgi:hypothetical protein